MNENETTGLLPFWPELHQAEPLAAIRARLGYGGKWILKTVLELSGQGIDRKRIAELFRPGPDGPIVWSSIEYTATKRAFERLKTQYRISTESLL